MREAKRKRDEDKKKKMDQLDIGMAPGKTHIDHEIIERILRDEDPFAPAEQPKDADEGQAAAKEELKVSTFVVDLQIPAPVSTRTSPFGAALTYHPCRKNQLRTIARCSAASSIRA